jgi:hypothetical protein
VNKNTVGVDGSSKCPCTQLNFECVCSANGVVTIATDTVVLKSHQFVAPGASAALNFTARTYGTVKITAP